MPFAKWNLPVGFVIRSATATEVPADVIAVQLAVVELEIDRDELQKVALNLLLNAVDATDGKGPILVEVGGGDPAFIRVIDEGCGIPEDFMRRHLFTPFKTTKKNGMGIGLFQSKMIVEAHGGKIEVQSQVNKGTTFIVHLPLVSTVR